MKQTFKIALGFGLVLLLAGCLGNNPQRIEVSTKPLDKPELNLPPVDELRLRRVEWVIVNEENLEAKLAELRSKGPLAMFVLTGEGYENLGLNFSDIRALVQQQQAIIIAYENYYKRAEEALDEANVAIESRPRGIDLNPFN
jgi:hypothetical protein